MKPAPIRVTMSRAAALNFRAGERYRFADRDLACEWISVTTGGTAILGFRVLRWHERIWFRLRALVRG